MRLLKSVCPITLVLVMVAVPSVRLTRSAAAQSPPIGHAIVTDLGGLAGCTADHVATAINASGTAVCLLYTSPSPRDS